MRTRLLALPAAFVALYALAWSPAGELPRAPAPRAKKATAEMLVGRWQVVTIDGERIPPDWMFTLEFTGEGTVIISVNDEKNRRGVKRGTYKLAGETITLTTPTEDGPDKSRDVRIKALSESELVTVLATPKERERMVFKRVIRE